jgi:putative endonuclease
MYWRVYLLRCSDNSLYCGVTTDIERRLSEHNLGVGSRYIRTRLPVRLVWSSGELTKSEAFKEEYRIKRLSQVAKDAMIASTLSSSGSKKFKKEAIKSFG